MSNKLCREKFLKWRMSALCGAVSQQALMLAGVLAIAPMALAQQTAANNTADTGKTAAAVNTASAAKSDASADTVEMILVTGSRRQARSAADVPAPVDLIGVDQLTKGGATPDVANMLRTAIPSLNIGDNPLSGTSSSIRPATMRGLSPDHTLVLINGKRLHRSADIATFSGGISDGSQGPDLSNIPSIAIKQVQVLRDGAAAVYGSDAIAGVINFIMNDDPDGGAVEAQAGSTYAGDGKNYDTAGTFGLHLGKKGFIRFSGEFGKADPTTRAVQRGDAAALQAAGFTNVPDPATRFGTPKVTDNIKTFVNMAVETGENGQFYAFGGYSRRRTQSDFFYRNPTGRSGVFTTTDDGGNYLVGDMTPGDGQTCDGGVDFGGTGVVNNPIAVGSPNAAARLSALAANPNCFSANNVYPGGFTPLFGSHLTDIEGTMGLRGEFGNGITYDVSFGAGRSQIKFDVSNDLNPSMGTLSPTTFDNLGTRIQSERTFNADFTKPIEVGFASPLTIAAGFEWHTEEFKVIPGAPASYEAGILANQGFLVGAEAYPGYTPTIAGTFTRSSRSVYLDLETDVTSKLVMGTAARYDDFTDFGHKLTYKVGGLYHITPDFGLRSTYSTGFHAPSPGQQNFSALTSEINSQGILVDTGVIPSTNPVALAVGGKQLGPETSKSYTVGAVYATKAINITLDFYLIKMRNRLTQTASQSLTDAQRAELIASGYSAAGGLGTFRFFTNDFSTTTKGIDLVASVPLKLTSTGNSDLSLAANYTKTKVTSFDPNDPNELLSQARVTQLEDNNPKWKGNLTFSHSESNWRAMARANYYGKYTELHVNSPGLRINGAARVTLDAEVGVNIVENVEFVVGAQNLLNTYPTRNPWDFILGSKYPTTAPSGINGGSYYAKIRYTF